MISGKYIGTAAWHIPKECRKFFPQYPHQLQSYSQIFNMVEINSSFYRHHSENTYRKWNTLTPNRFRFSIKMNREITHQFGLNVDPKKYLDRFRAIFSMEKLGCLLVQLPPSMEYSDNVAWGFLSELRSIYEGVIAVEPRHISWAKSEAIQLFQDLCLTKVEADPDPCPWPVKMPDLPRYIRLHGSPKIYKSSYSNRFLKQLGQELKNNNSVWVVFDNTQYGAATQNALDLYKYLND